MGAARHDSALLCLSMQLLMRTLLEGAPPSHAQTSLLHLLLHILMMLPCCCCCCCPCHLLVLLGML